MLSSFDSPDPTETPLVTSEPVFDQDGVSLNRPSGVQCPACQTELEIGQVHGRQFAGCPKCNGMLFPQPVFADLIQYLRAMDKQPPETPKPMNADELRVHRLCPACAGQFETHPYNGPGNAVIDTCFECQLIWFDDGELTKLVRAPGRR